MWKGLEKRKDWDSLKLLLASRRSSVDPIAEGKKFPKVSRKSCGRNLKSGSKSPKGK
jgi:hypothetical protein